MHPKVDQPTKQRHRATIRRNARPNIKESLHREFDELVILELTQEGGRQYLHFTVRQLYNHVLKAITKLPITSHSYSENVIPFSGTQQRRASLNLEGSHLKDTLLKTRTEIFEESHINLPTSQKNIGHQRTVSGNVTYRERLGGHLHPRDMRRLVTPFSLSNEPELIVRRHAILLNCDPLRAIILRDKLMILVPDGADSLLDTIEKRVRGGAAGVENDIFGETSDGLHVFSNAKPSEENKPLLAPNDGPSDLHLPLDYGQETDKIKNVQLDDEEINELSARMNLPFELQCLDAVLHAVTELLANEADELEEKTLTTIEHLLKVESAEGKFAQEMLRASKNNVHAMISRVNGFNRAMTQILNEEEDLALCNLSRLISHPERFIQPVSPQILEEESDEPELILEAYLHSAVTLTNELDSLDVQLHGIEGLLHMKSDTLRNRILFINLLSAIIITILTINLCFVGFFSVNLKTKLYLGDPGFYFRPVVIILVCGSVALIAAILLLLRRAGIRTTAI